MDVDGERKTEEFAVKKAAKRLFGLIMHWSGIGAWAKCTYSLVAHNCQVWQSIFIDQLTALSED